MTDEQSAAGQAQGQDPATTWVKAGSWMSDEDEAVLHHWRESSILLDPRYKSKALLKFVALSMSDAAFRSRLLTDTERVFDEFQGDVDWPEGLSIRFVENTPETLHVVLPPRAGEVGYQPVSLREALRSRTAADSFLNDDWDIGNTDSRDWDGDPDSRDDPNWPPHPIKL